MSSYVIAAAAVGAGATLVMDLWNLFLKRGFGLPSLDYCHLGRWLCHMQRGTFRHDSIAAAPAMLCECAVGWTAHYSIGFVFALAFLALAPGWLAQPTLPPALLYGLATVVFPLFLMQPLLGFGVAASRTASPARARLKSLATHTAFGVGLYLAALLVGRVLQVRAD